MPLPDAASWICCQIGAREHYAIPRALNSAGRLHSLLTDVWCLPGLPLWGGLKRRVSGRFNPELAGIQVHSWNTFSFTFELWLNLRGQTGWAAIMSRNDWFQDLAVGKLEAIRREYPSRKFVVFAYSYAALRIFQFAKNAGWVAVLGQIDPGPAEEKIVARLHERSSLVKAGSSWAPAPALYWDKWRMECELADRIIVNSAWTCQGLTAEGISERKTCTVPLALQPAFETRTFNRVYPKVFSPERPLRLLFLGQAGLRKGIEVVIQAADRLIGQPVEIWIVGPVQVDRTAAHNRHPVLRWFGSVPRSAVNQYYRNADAFLFPTFSDGFGITQLEALAWKLPLIVSRYCGNVVDPGLNGLLLDPLSSSVLVDTVLYLLRNPGHLDRMARQATLIPEHTMSGLAGRLTSALDESHSRT